MEWLKQAIDFGVIGLLIVMSIVAVAVTIEIDGQGVIYIKGSACAHSRTCHSCSRDPEQCDAIPACGRRDQPANHFPARIVSACLSILPPSS
jgi:hypothetical protein